METFISDSIRWAEETFGNCDLGDGRRMNRLIDYSAKQAEDPDGSIPRICQGDKSAEEGVYRFMRNEYIDASSIAEGMFEATAQKCEGRNNLLAIQDTTTVSVAHEDLKKQLAQQGCPNGFMVHTTLMVDGESGEAVGWIDQNRWLRKKDRPGKGTRKQRPYKERESYKWEESHIRMVSRLPEETVDNVITISDRESDIFEYLVYLTDNGFRFVVRSSVDRVIKDGHFKRLRDELSHSPVIGYRKVTIEQRGKQNAKRGQKERKGRKKRIANMEVRAAPVTLYWSGRHVPERAQPIKVNAVFLKELDAPEDIDEPLEWLLFTSERIETPEQCEFVIGCYETRWITEDMYKCWKTGCRVESRPHRNIESIERMMVITSAVAVRIFQLRTLASEDNEFRSCEEVLTQEEWECLWTTTVRSEPLPESPPSAQWALFSLGRLGGWSDSKRTGRVGWQALWRGYDRLQERLVGFRFALSVSK